MRAGEQSFMRLRNEDHQLLGIPNQPADRPEDILDNMLAQGN